MIKPQGPLTNIPLTIINAKKEENEIDLSDKYTYIKKAGLMVALTGLGSEWPIRLDSTQF